MSFILDKQLEAKLTTPLSDIDKGVARVFVDIIPDHYGEERLRFRVALRDGVVPARPSAAFGKRLQNIATALRDRAARMQVPLLPSIDFILESELSRRRKTA